ACSRMAFDEHRCLGLAYLPGRDTEHQLGEPVCVRFELETVQTKEHECRHEAGALVPVDERMVPDEVVEVGGGHLREAGVQVAAAESGLRQGGRRLAERRHADGAL